MSRSSVGAALAIALWAVCVVLHLDLALRDRLAWAPIYVAPSAEGTALRVTGFWAETALDDDAPRMGDRILAVAGEPIGAPSRLGFLAAVYAAAEEHQVALRVERDGRPVETRLRLIPYQAPWVFAPLILGLGASALVIFLRRGELPGARLFALASSAYSLHWAAFLSGGGWRTTLGFAVHVGALALTFPLVLRAVQRFDPRQLRRAASRWPWLFLAIGPIHASWQIGTPLPPTVALPLLLAGYAALVVCLLGGLAITYTRGDALVRRQLRWVLLGFYLALAPVGTAAAIVSWEPAWRPLYEWSLLALLILPIAITVALTRFDLFDIDRLVSSTAAYSIVLVVGLAGAIRAAPSVAGLTGRSTDLSPELVQSGLALAFGGALVLGGRWVRPRVEAWFFRERVALESGVRELRDSVRRFDAPGALVEDVGARLAEILDLEDLTVYVRSEDAFVPLFARGPAVPPAFEGDGRLPPLLDEADGPVEAQRWQRWSERGLLGELERAQLEGLDAKLLIPIAGEKRLAGFAALGEKGSGDLYTPVDRALLEGLFDRVAMQLDRFDATAIQEAERGRTARLAGYVPAAVRDELMREDPDEAPGEREVSLLFVDVRGYTSLAQGLTPDEIFRVVNAYTTAVSRVIQQHGGWVVEFQGDGLMAVFGAPRALPGKERAAIRAALESVRAVEGGIEAIADVPLRVGVGVATGPAYVGNVQSIDRKIWCVIGNTTNLAARLQGMSRDLDVSIVIDDRTHRRGGEEARAFAVRDGVRVKGRSEDFRVHVA